MSDCHLLTWLLLIYILLLSPFFIHSMKLGGHEIAGFFFFFSFSMASKQVFIQLTLFVKSYQ